MTKGAAPIALLFALVPADAMAKNTQFWNLTANPITSLRLSPAGANDWGPDQTDNDFGSRRRSRRTPQDHRRGVARV